MEFQTRPSFLKPNELWNDPTMKAAEFQTPTYIWKEYYILKNERKYIEHPLIRPYYELVPLEWEEEITKREKPTGDMQWTMGSPRLLAQNLSLTFPTLRFWRITNHFYIQHKDYLLQLENEDLNTYIYLHTPHCGGLSPKFMKDTLDLLKSEKGVYVTHFDHKSGGVPFRNCVKGANPTAPHAYAKWHNIDYIENAKLPLIFRDYIIRLVPNKVQRDKLYAYMCYMLFENKAIQQLLILQGEKGIGKSELLKFIGATIISMGDVDIKHILKDRGSETAMRDVFICIFDEISSLDVDVEVRDKIKKWATQLMLNIRGVYETGTMNTPWFARVIMSTNELPYSQYIDPAYLSRICLILCYKSFEEPIPDFVDLLLEQKDAIWSWIYDHYHSKMIQILGIRSDLTLAQYNAKVNPFQQFLHTIEADSEHLFYSKDLYQHYLTFAKETPCIASEFGKKLKDVGIEKKEQGNKTYYKCRLIPIQKILEDYTDEELEEMERLVNISNNPSLCYEEDDEE